MEKNTKDLIIQFVERQDERHFFFFEKVVYIKYLFVSSNILNLESNHVT